MCQVAHFSEVDVDDDQTGDSRYVRPFHIEDLFARYEEDELDDFELSLDPDEDDDDDSDDEEDDDDTE